MDELVEGRAGGPVIGIEHLQGALTCGFRSLLPSTAFHWPRSAPVQLHANELELGFYLFQPPHAELTKPQNVLDPAVGWLG